MNSKNLEKRIDNIFMNSENSKTSDPHRLLLNLLRRITRGREGGRSPLPFFKNWKKCPNLWKKMPRLGSSMGEVFI